MVPITPIRMVRRLTLWHCFTRVCFNLLCCLVALASCCSGRVSSQYLTSMRWTSQRKGRIACVCVSFMAIFCSDWRFANNIWSRAGSKFICWKVGKTWSHWGKVLLATCAGKIRLCWAIVSEERKRNDLYVCFKRNNPHPQLSCCQSKKWPV